MVWISSFYRRKIERQKQQVQRGKQPAYSWRKNSPYSCPHLHLSCNGPHIRLLYSGKCTIIVLSLTIKKIPNNLVRSVFLIYLLLSAPKLLLADDFIFQNKAYTPEIQSPQVYPADDPLGFPYYELYGATPLEFHFDWMQSERPTLSYGVIHCDRFWRRSDALSSLYINGFPWTTIEDATSSFNTTLTYAHYTFQFPNEQSQPKYSGQYAVVVFEGSDIEDVSSYLVTFRIIVYEAAVGIRATCTPSSDVSQRRYRQQVDFDVLPGGFRATSPMRDISATVLQNYTWQRSVSGLKPIFITPTSYTFDYNGECDFDAGNEWRMFEFKNVQFRSRFVANITNEADGLHVYLEPDELKGAQSYSNQPDFDGRMFVKNDLGEDWNSDANYAQVHFFLRMPMLMEGQLKIEYPGCEFYGGGRTCTWNDKRQGYECTLLMKQGVQNYRYVITDRYHPQPDLSLTEGNHSESTNVYTVLVHFQDLQLGLDRILNLFTVNSRN